MEGLPEWMPKTHRTGTSTASPISRTLIYAEAFDRNFTQISSGSIVNAPAIWLLFKLVQILDTQIAPPNTLVIIRKY